MYHCSDIIGSTTSQRWYFRQGGNCSGGASRQSVLSAAAVAITALRATNGSMRKDLSGRVFR